MTDELRNKLIDAASSIVGGIHAINVVKAIEPIVDEHVAERLGQTEWLASPSGEVGD